MSEDSPIKYFTEDNFNESIAHGVTLVDFYADWCGPCRVLTPILESVAEEMQGKVTFAKIDIDQAQDIAAKYEVMSIPTLILFKDGKEVNRLVGLREAADIKRFASSAS